MAKIILDGVAHSYMKNPLLERDYALKSIQHEWHDGGAYALLGPSGCGKTTLLNVISGLVRPSRGRVIFGRQDVTLLPPEKRNIAQIFQFPVVYETMTVAENLAFPLRNQNIPKPERDRRVGDVLAMLDLEAAAGKRARNLGADTKQKISLGRGLVRTDANAILFDEPLTVIDPALKWQLRAQLKKVHREFSHTMIYVTHDQTEALTFADKVVVMREGEVLQIGTPEELFDSPSHTFVGRFIGSPGMNILPCEVHNQTAIVGAHRIPLDQSYCPAAGGLELGIRPEYVDLTEETESDNGLPVTVCSVENLGRYKIVEVKLEQHKLKVMLQEGRPVPRSPHMSFHPERVKIYQDSVLLSSARG
ncbi:MAG: ABC transporter ATP-binding protein [Halieaceae bacterium]|jgi:glycerol transport system ATP-binding protein|nr:ABC transporter ATP-binding protein [Halieaceae bacterium]